MLDFFYIFHHIVLINLDFLKLLSAVTNSVFVKIDVAQIIRSTGSWLISSGRETDNSVISGEMPLKINFNLKNTPLLAARIVNFIFL